MSALLLLVGIIAQPGTGTVFGTVTNDLDSTTIAGATVVLWERNASDSATTDSLGLYSLELTPGRHTLNASYGDYVPTSRAVTLDSGRRVRVDFQIHPKPVEMPAVQVQGIKKYMERRHDEPNFWVPAPPKRFSTAAAVQLILRMDTQRQRDALTRLLDDLCRPAPDFEGLPHRKSQGSCRETDGESRWSVSKRDIGSAGWDHALGRVPGVVVR
jgi:hypothetical protein